MRTLYICFLASLSLFISIISNAQEIRGKVIAEGGYAATSVSVRFKNKANAVTTNADGRFTIVAKKLPDTLYFSAVGFEPYSVVVTEETLKDPNFEIVLLNSRSGALSEVVVVGYGTKRKSKSVGYSTSTVKGVDLGSYAAPTTVTSDAYGSVAELKVRGVGRAYERTPLAYSSAGETYLNNKKIGLTDTTIFDKAAPYANILTAGEVNDFYKWKMWEDFTESEFKQWSELWKINPKKRITVQLVNTNHNPVIGEKVELRDESSGKIIWTAYTDNTGKAELWGDISGKNDEQKLKIITADGKELSNPGFFENGINTIRVDKPCSVSDKVDIAFAVDATGSMGDEIEFLKLELEDVIRKTFEQYKNLNLNAGSVFYRDRNDEYLTKHIDFKSDLLKLLNFVKLQRAAGGGDYPEAVESALSTALDSLQWRADARSRMMLPKMK
jgi:hypothetical protein